MGASTFSGPVKAGTVREGASANVGNVVLAQSDTLAYTDTTAKDIAIVPASSQILGFAVYTSTAFNAGTNNVINIRIGTTVIASVTATAANITVGLSTVVPVNAEVARYISAGTTDTTINAIFAPTGTAASTGAATIIVQYVQV